MKILHYALGFYPYRTGGLTAYVMDVMQEQQRQGHQVGMLWPGRMNLIGKKQPGIKKGSWNWKTWNKNRNKGEKESEIKSYELVNPLPVPLLEGVADIAAYMKKCDKGIFKRFLAQLLPEVIHVHTFMGLYAEFLQAAEELHIPVVYTTHDYFPVCPKVNLICGGKNCDSGMEDGACTKCNQGALPEWKIILMQSLCYRKLKNMALLRRMRKQYHIEKQEQDVLPKEIKETLPYHLLSGYYKAMLQRVDCVLCNSTNTKEIYEKFGAVNKTYLFPITNGRIKDKRKIKRYDKNQKLRLTYLGAATEAKGYFFLRSVLDKLEAEGEKDFCLNIYTPTADKRSYLRVHEPYEGEKGMETVYDDTDILLVPSLWKETFGFVVPEALAHGTPVIVTENVGAKNLIETGKNGYCIEAQEAELLKVLKDLLHNRFILKQMNGNIRQSAFDFSMEGHVRRLQKIYGELRQQKSGKR